MNEFDDMSRAKGCKGSGMLSLRYQPPVSMHGQSALTTLEKLWSSPEDFRGRTHGLGFLFLYNLMQGTTKVNCITKAEGFGVWGGGFRSKSDSHRFALLAAQLYSDKSQRGLLASVVNVLGRNRHVCVRMPKFKDTRKARQSPIYNGWTDESEPRAPIAELFGKLVPGLQRLKRQRGALRYPPRPPFPEMPMLPKTVQAAAPASASGVVPTVAPSACAQLSDSSRDSRTIRPLSSHEVLRLCNDARFMLGAVAKPPPLLRR